MSTMNRLPLRTIFAATLVVLAAGDGARAGDTSNNGFLTALAAQQAAVRDAQASFWNKAAACVNDNESEQELMDCVNDAQAEFDEDLALIEQQFFARILLLPVLGFGGYSPDYDPEDFTTDITNPYFPLVPGRTLVYEAHTDDGLERIEVTALDELVEIAEVTCRAVHDVVKIGGEVVEDTIDWYAQDDDGNVWYFGELALNYEDGFVADIGGSWRADVDEAEPGIIMPAQGLVGHAYRQEFLVNEAEDYAVVLSLSETVTVPAGTFTQCRRTQDGTALEPGVIEHKLFAPGVGFVKGINPSSGNVVELIEIIDPQ